MRIGEFALKGSFAGSSPTRNAPSREGGWPAWLFEPTDGAGLGAFRVLFGALMFVEVLRYYGSGWIHSYYIAPQFHFTYLGFSWVKPWPGWGMYVHFGVLAMAAIGVMLGWYYRLSAGVFFLGFGYVFLLEKAHYLNHFYVILLLAGLLSFLPAERCFSLDAKRRPIGSLVPAYAPWILKAQLVIVYVYAAIAKLNADWLRGEPLTTWLSSLGSVPLLGPFLATSVAGLLLSYGGIIVDGVLAPLLLWQRTRMAAALFLLAFHLMNAAFFQIGIFPWLMIGALTLFFEPAWPRRVAAAVAEHLEGRRNRALQNWLEMGRYTNVGSVPERSRPWILVALGGYLVLQLTVPLRHHLYPGDVAWTDEGHRFSWRMKLRQKEGKVHFFVRDPGELAMREILLERMLTPRQIAKMSCKPDMILELSHHLADRFARDGKKPHVFVRAPCSLHGRPMRLLIDPDVDLAEQPWSLWPASWIRPGP